MKYEWRVLKCCVPSKWFCFECLLERREDKRTRTSHTHTRGARENRPGFDRHDFVADILVLFDEDRAVDDLVPDGRIVGPVHHVNLDFDRSR